MSTATFEKSMDFASLDRAGMQGWVRHALAMAAIVLLGTLLSLAMSGYVPLYNNNAYHLPILTGAYDLPQFQSDPFIQSLRHFSSGFWMLFAGIGKHVDPVLFLGFWMVASRLLFIVASLSVARALGFSGLRFSLAFVGLIATSACCVGLPSEKADSISTISAIRNWPMP